MSFIPQHISEFFVVRHGETAWNAIGKIQGHSDIPLNETGRLQAAQGQRLISPLGTLKIYSSDLERALDTAKIMTQQDTANIIINPLFRERNFGLTDGMMSDDVAEYFRQNPHHAGIDFQGPFRLSYDAETTAQLWARIRQGLKIIDQPLPLGTRPIIFAHSGVVRVLRQFLGGADLPTMAEHCTPYHFKHQADGVWQYQLLN
jgi:broad specificity phosphatase PhoE